MTNHRCLEKNGYKRWQASRITENNGAVVLGAP